ncbi:tRNA (guanosine(37)-N1)-methyltransferase TrmD [Acidobacteriota bacterium]
MKFDVITIFPSMFEGFVTTGLIARALEKRLLTIQIHDLRDHTGDRHRTVDDLAYGGGGGMVFKPEPVFKAVESLTSSESDRERAIILMTPRGRLLRQELVEELSGLDELIMICGRYEGVDERVASHLVTHEISLGDFVLSGGEIPAMALIESVSRQIPGVVGNPECVVNDSFSNSLLEHPHYTRPAEYRGYRVPDVILSGNHEAIRFYRKTEALRLTLERRPDMIRKEELDDESRKILNELKRGQTNGYDG